jgi:hypothetical protein
MRTSPTAIATLLILATMTERVTAAVEPVLFFDARADQTASTNGGTAIWSLTTNTWHWWYQNVSQANVSPDGKMVVYIYQGNLIITTPSGQNAHVLSANAAYPAWSPQGDRIAFFYGSSLRIISPSGVVLQTAVTNVFNYHCPSWSPDGKKIAFSGGMTVQEVGCELFAQACPSYRTLSTIYTVDLDSGVQTPLFTPTYVSWVAGTFVANHTTYTTFISEQVKLDHPVWSPDGQRIAARKLVWRYHTYSPDVPTGWKAIEANVVTIPATGGDPTPVTSDTNPSPYEDATLRDSFPASWAEDGLYYIKHRGSSIPVQEQGTYVTSGFGPGTRINSFVSPGTQGAGGTHVGTLQRATLNQTGDLLIKRDSESLFGGTYVYQTTPSGSQSRTNKALQNILSQFQIEIQNEDNQPHTFKLAATETDKTGWNAQYLFGVQDISAQLRTASGFQFPTLATQATFTVTVRMTATNVPVGTILRTVFSLTDTNDPGTIIDSVAAATECVLPTLMGHTFCICDSNAIAKANVQIGTNHLTTDASGYFVWSNAPPQTYSVGITASNYVTLNTNWVVNANDVFQTNDYYLTNLFFVIDAMMDTNIMSLANADVISNELKSVAAAYSGYIADPMCVKILFSAATNGLGASLAHSGKLSYSQYLADLASNPERSAMDIAAAASLNPPPYTGIFSNAAVWLKAANLQVIGEQALVDQVIALDGGINGHIWLYFPIINLTRPPANTNFYDLRATAMHEINEILGSGGAGSVIGDEAYFPDGVGSLDLYRYAAPGVRSYSPYYDDVSYFSIDGGTNVLVHFNQAGNNSDYGDWGNGNTNGTRRGNSPGQLQDAFGHPGGAADMGANEFIALDIIGYTLKANSAIQNPTYDGTSFKFEVATVPGQTYQVQSVSSPSQGSWQNVGSQFVAMGMIANVTNTVGDGQQFYRVMSVSPPPSMSLRSSYHQLRTDPVEVSATPVIHRVIPRGQ